MKIRELSIAFAGGAYAALIYTILFWLAIKYQLAAKIGVNWPIAQTWLSFTHELYFNITWGGLLALLFCLPLLKKSWWQRGLIISLVPTLIQLIYYIPNWLSGGMFGLDFGNYTFVLILVANAIWGLITAFWVKKLA